MSSNCTNFKLCGNNKHPKFAICSDCLVMFRKQLVFPNEEITCPICLECTNQSVKHPAGCGHSICQSCCQEVWPKPYKPINPNVYGMTTNCGCVHCTTGSLCVAQQQALRSSSRWNEFMAATRAHEHAYHIQNRDRYNMKNCSICRAKLNDAKDILFREITTTLGTVEYKHCFRTNKEHSSITLHEDDQKNT